MSIRVRCLTLIRQAGKKGITPDEAAAKMQRHILTVRPRFTDLFNEGVIKPKPQKRVSHLGNPQAVWVLA